MCIIIERCDVVKPTYMQIYSKEIFFYLSAYSCGKFMWRIKEKTAKDDFNEDVIRKDFKRLKNGMKY